MAPWRVPAALTAAVVLAQVAHRTPVVDVVSGRPPDDLALAYPLSHVLLAPLTLLADWLNGGSRGDLLGFAAWTLVVYVACRLLLPRRHPAPATRHLIRELVAATVFVAGFALFLAWGALARRPIPRLVAADSALLAFDVHSHTSRSRDGRPGFGSHQNAEWHRRAGFDAAFVTDHNTTGAASAWRLDRAGRAPRLLDGEELSLWRTHIVVLGNAERIDNAGWNDSWDSTLALLRLVRSGARRTAHGAPYLIASLPEYWRYHWGTDLGAMVAAGVEGFEIWTTSPKAMDFPPDARAVVIARATVEGRALFGATDMHGLGYAATVWNVARLPGWRGLDDAALTAALVARFRADGPGSHRVVALRRWQPRTPAAYPAAVPLNAWLLLRTASRAHALALLGWIWLVPLAAALRDRRRAPPTP